MLASPGWKSELTSLELERPMNWSAKFGGVYEFKFGFDQWSYDVGSFMCGVQRKAKASV